MYLDVVKAAAAKGGLQKKDSKGVVDGVSIAGLDGPAALGVVWVVVGKVQWLHHSSVLAWDEHALASWKQTPPNTYTQHDFKKSCIF